MTYNISDWGWGAWSFIAFFVAYYILVITLPLTAVVLGAVLVIAAVAYAMIGLKASFSEALQVAVKVLILLGTSFAAAYIVTSVAE